VTESRAVHLDVYSGQETAPSASQRKVAHLMHACRQGLSPSARDTLTASSIACIVRQMTNQKAYRFGRLQASCRVVEVSEIE
jgi:hypothetical protein